MKNFILTLIAFVTLTVVAEAGCRSRQQVFIRQFGCQPVQVQSFGFGPSVQVREFNGPFFNFRSFKSF